MHGAARQGTKKEAGAKTGMDKEILERLQVAAAVAEEEKIYTMDPEFAWERLTKSRQHAGHYGAAVLEKDIGEKRVPERGEVVLSSSGVIALPQKGMKPIKMEDFSPRVAHY